MASSTSSSILGISSNTPSTLVLDPSTDCHQRSRWESPQAPYDPPPPLVERVHQTFFPVAVQRPQRVIYGYGDASQRGAGGHWSIGTNVFLWRIPMGMPTSPADTLSRWRTQTASLAHSDDSLPRPNVLEFLRRVQTQELVQDLANGEMEELEYVD
jgi:hypothetical protein